MGSKQNFTFFAGHCDYGLVGGLGLAEGEIGFTELATE